ncbi:hypothetical protein EOD41_13175 [Mucilaginibacter limnophilus]|uniref:Alkaline phosphatase n=1 Tax=Mucilaginibacter limnophilus TaxID=1932778 RepID=A0A437MS23_9SPHI|nr:hypothetical protein [Mucilaginibacter limnophilus]RVU00424.1 hypothetical protein EOD41_13175 [Mucilaginibacter limnophilus]
MFKQYLHWLFTRVLTLVIISFCIVCKAICQDTSFPQGFAHNDYLHKRPLNEALENGFTHIEADVHLLNGKLIIAHYFPYFKSQRTLEKVYLKPLAAYLLRDSQKVAHAGASSIVLMIDIKTNAAKTYEALKPVLKKYENILTSYHSGVIKLAPVTIVLSGHKPLNIILNEDSRLVFADIELDKIEKFENQPNVFLMASCKYSKFLSWRGNGPVPVTEDIKLREYIKMAHERNEKVRLYAAPENQKVWSYLLSIGVDLINADNLVNLRKFLFHNQFQFALNRNER